MTTRVQFQQKPFDVFIGRPEKWCNPFPIRKDRTREESVRLFEKWIRGKPELLCDLPELEGKILGCWCKEGELCHGDVLIKILDERKQPMPLGEEVIVTHGPQKDQSGVLLGCFENDDLWAIQVGEGTEGIVEAWYFQCQLKG